MGRLQSRSCVVGLFPTPFRLLFLLWDLVFRMILSLRPTLTVFPANIS